VHYRNNAVGYQLDYFANDYKAAKQFTGTTATQYAFSAANANMPTLAATPTQSLYNGNIRQMRTSFHANLTVSNASGTFFAAADDGVFRYGYDQLNRLRTQQLWSPATTTATAATLSDRFFMKLAYDANGNILKLVRNGEAMSSSNPGPREMDALAYNYNTQNNQLNYVKDVANGGLPTAYPDDIENQELNNYTYDAIGNLIADASEGTRMRWNVGGKLFKVEKETQNVLQTVNYEYDATGNRILKEVIDNQAGTTQRTYYTRDAQGNTLATYLVSISPQSSGLPNAKFEAWSLYGSSRLGEWKPSQNGVGSGSISAGSVSEPNDPVFGEALAQPQPMTTPNWTNWVARRVVAERRYEISNHLGNVLATVLDRKTVTTGTTTTTTIAYTAAHLFRADIATATDYYAFGQPMPTRDYKATWSTEYRYGMNTQEKSPEIQAFHTTALYWEYDSRIGRRWNVDPVVKPWESPYMCFGDNPITGSDVLGNTTDWIPQVKQKEEKGKTIGYLSIVKEEGDNVESLAKFLSVDKKEAKEIFGIMDKEGNIRLPEKIAGAINRSIQDAIDNPDNYDNNAIENYNCWGSTIAIAENQPKPRNTQYRKGLPFCKTLLSDAYENVSEQPDKITFGKTAIRMAEVYPEVKHWWGVTPKSVSPNTIHGCTFLGKSKNGTEYVWTKNGWHNKPTIMRLDAVLELYSATVQGCGPTKNEGGYYNYKY
jgi:hypothetical protein